MDQADAPWLAKKGCDSFKGSVETMPFSAQPRPRWWWQLALPASMFVGYDALCRLRPQARADGLRDGAQLLHGWASVGVGAERALNSWVFHHQTVAAVVARYYDLMHYGVAIAVLVALYFWAPAAYRPMRDVMWVITAIALMVFWLHPMAPPRMYAGFHDIVGSVTGQREESADSSFYSAMPSLHMAWACWAAIAGQALTDRRPLKALLIAHPIVTAFAVVATAEHWILDVVAGVLTFAAAYGLRVGTAKLATRFVHTPAGIAEPA